jgi:hypothetical protein
MAKDVTTTRRVFGPFNSYKLYTCPNLPSKLDIASTYDPKDPTAATPETRRKAQVAPLPSLDSSLQGLRIGIPQVSHTPSFHNDILPIVHLRNTSLPNWRKASFTPSAQLSPLLRTTEHPSYQYLCHLLHMRLVRIISLRVLRLVVIWRGMTVSSMVRVYLV